MMQRWLGYCALSAFLLGAEAKAVGTEPTAPKHARFVEPLRVDASAMPCYTDTDCLSSEVCHTVAGERQGTCMFNSETSDADLQREMGATVLAGQGLDVKSLTMVPQHGQSAMLNFASSTPKFHVGVGANGTFHIMSGANDMLTIDSCGGQGGCKIKAHGNLVAGSDLKIRGQLIYNGGSQWFTAQSDNFDQVHEGLHTGPKPKNPWVWKGESGTQYGFSTCGGTKKMLGGYGLFAGGEVSKTFKGLKMKHKEIRVRANFHFIDSWESETAYMKVNGHYMWTDIYDYQVARTGVNICGSVAAEGRYTQIIDVVMPHNTTDVTITFGTTLDQSPFDESWGVDDIEILSR